MRYGKRLVSLIAALFLLAALAQAAPASVDPLVAKGLQLFAQRADLGKAALAVKAFEAAHKASPKNPATAILLARALYWLGNHQKGDAAVATLEKGVNLMKAMAESNPKNLDAQFWLAVGWSYYGRAKGVMKSLSLVNPIKEKLNLIIKADPKYAGGAAYRVLGRVYFKVPGFFGGSNSKSIANLKKAVALSPKHWQNHLFLAETYLDEGEKEKARALLKQVIAGPAPAGYEPDYTEWKAAAQKLMKKIK